MEAILYNHSRRALCGTALAPIFDPLRNAGTSLVLFLLVSGVDTPTSLAEKVGVGAPVIVRQLQRLHRIRVVVPGKKTGRDRHYGVNWKNLVEIAVRRSLYAPQKDWSPWFLDHVKAGFLRDRKFVDFVQAYLRIQVEQEIRARFASDRRLPKQRRTRTFAELLEGFHIVVLNMMSDEEFLSSLKTEDTSLQQVVRSLARWREVALAREDGSGQAFKQALREIGFPISLDSDSVQ